MCIRDRYCSNRPRCSLPVSYTHLRAHETLRYLVCRLLLEKNEGAIEFGLNGKFYSDVNSPKVIYQPKLGDIILFPSSLHHKTIPFSTNTDRISIAFDLMPKGVLYQQ